MTTRSRPRCTLPVPPRAWCWSGIPGSDRTSFPAALARQKGLSFLVSRRMNQTYPRAIELVRSGRIDVTSLVTHRFPLDRSAEAFESASRRDGLKVVIEIP